MGWQKEKAEHPWATKAQAKRIAHDHTAKTKKKHSCHTHSEAGPVQAARVDVAKNMQWSKKIAHKKVI